jgi:ATP-dependent Clp protease adaptor protein ClpS
VIGGGRRAPDGAAGRRTAGCYSAPVTTPRGATKEQTETKTRPETSLAPPWNVIVHDDPVTLMTYVTKVFMQVFGYPQEQANRLMLEVHKEGRSVVWTGAREQAEVYAQKLQAHHLLTSLESVDG